MITEYVDRFPAPVGSYDDRESSKDDLSGFVAEYEIGLESNVDEARASIVACREYSVEGTVYPHHHELPLSLEFFLEGLGDFPVLLNVEIYQLVVSSVWVSPLM